MGWKDFFRKTKDQGLDPLKDLNLGNLKKGWMIDYDMNTWQVASADYYDWGGGDLSYEWQLISSNDTIYLEREPDDEDFWCITRKVELKDLGSGLRKLILENGEPPDEIDFKGVTYHMEESGGGRYFKDGADRGQEFLQWSYEDSSGKKIISIEQWGEDDFEAAAGIQVEEYQFTNIIPSE